MSLKNDLQEAMQRNCGDSHTNDQIRKKFLAMPQVKKAVANNETSCCITSRYLSRYYRVWDTRIIIKQIQSLGLKVKETTENMVHLGGILPEKAFIFDWS